RSRNRRQTYLLQTAARNPGLIMRTLFAIGKPRGLQPASVALLLANLIQVRFAKLWTEFY
ncbi:MAG: hypothetical protein RJP95_00890, partial [Pirellulales bacterium]